MKTLRALTLATVAAAGLHAANANAATFVCGVDAKCDFTEADGSGAFTNKVGGGSFSDLFKVALSKAGEVIVTLTSSPIGVTFSTLTFNGSPFTVGVSGTSFLVGPGSYDLVLEGTSTRRSATYTGTIDFIPAVPEPAAWALMLVGFGAVGMTLRRRQDVRVSFA